MHTQKSWASPNWDGLPVGGKVFTVTVIVATVFAMLVPLVALSEKLFLLLR